MPQSRLFKIQISQFFFDFKKLAGTGVKVPSLTLNPAKFLSRRFYYSKFSPNFGRGGFIIFAQKLIIAFSPL